MDHTTMPFLMGPAPSSDGPASFELTAPPGDLVAVLPLSKTQLALWFNYLKQPLSSHYLLTLKISLSVENLSVERLIQAIHDLGAKHSMLRTTFHVDTAADQIAMSYMAVHKQTSSQPIELIIDQSKLHEALRRPFDLSLQFPIRWVVLMTMAVECGVMRTGYTVFAVAHHIAVDGASMSILSHELQKQLQPDEKAPPKLVGLQYGDYIHRQEAFLKSSAGSAARDFWIAQLQQTRPYEWTAPCPKQCGPLDYRKLETWNFFSNTELAEWGNMHKTSWFRVAVSSLALALAGISKPQPHHDNTLMVAFGARPQEFGECVSHMANTMPIKFPMSTFLRTGASFTDVVKVMGHSISTAKKHEMFPFMSLMDGAKETMPLDLLDFKVAVTFSPKLADNSCELYPVEGVWDLFFCFLGHDDGVSLGVISNPRVFGQEALDKLRSTFTAIVAETKDQPTLRVTDLEFLQNASPAQFIRGPEIDDVGAISRSRVHSLIKARAATQPALVALSSAERGTQMTYAELSIRSSHVAHFLHRKGVGKGDKVLVHLDRGFEQVTWILGVMEAGACYIVVDKAWPTARKAAIVKIAQAACVVTDVQQPELSATEEMAVVSLADCVAELASMPDGPLECEIADDDLAYVVFTSGSTGQPKGVMVEHSNLSHYVSSTRDAVKLGPHSRVLQLASFAFDAVILEYAVTLAYGGTLCFADRPQILVGEYLADIIDMNDINFFHCTPSVLSTLPSDRPLPSLRIVSVGGESSPPGLLDQWRKRVELLHAYGPTETTVIVTIEHLSQNEKPAQPSTDATIIGKALPNSTILICNETSLDALPFGQHGEICIAGPQVTRGYMGQESLTSTKFHNVTLAEGFQTRLYRTGDKGFLDEAGKLHIQGRIGNREIKVRGYRVDLHEIEKSIMVASPDVTMTSVQLVEDSLVGLMVPSTVDCERVRDCLLRDMPHYAVPTQLIAVPELPLNMNGKIDHEQVGALARELVKQYRSDCHGESPAALGLDMVPKSPGMEVACEATRREAVLKQLTVEVSSIWAQLLGNRREFDPEVAFFDAGGHSLLLTQLHQLIKEKFSTGSRPSLIDIFSMSSIRRQVDFLADVVDFNTVLERTPFHGNLGASLSCPDISSSSSTSSQPTASSTMTSVDERNTEQRYAIVGMACRFPDANTIEDLWSVLLEQRDAVTTFDQNKVLPFSLDSQSVFVPRYGSIQAALESFDPSVYSISESDAQKMDPQKGVFLDVASEALADAGIGRTGAGVRETAEKLVTGVFVGAAPNTFLAAYQETSSLQSFENHYKHLLDCPIATFAAYKLNLTGPNITLNTACSSSLSALRLACASLSQGDCDTALVGGVSIAFPQEDGYVTTSNTSAVFLPSGICHPLDARADGCVPADGVAAIVVKRLDQALQDNDQVYAVIEGIAIGSDGAVDKAGLGVPSSSGQSRTVETAVRRAGAEALQNLRYIEMHGSGTAWGDALEVNGLKLAFEKLADVPSKQRAGNDAILGTPGEIFVGSNKGNFGNAEAASGLLSLIKASLALKSGVMPPIRSFEQPNPVCDLTGSGFSPLVKQMGLTPQDRVGVTSLGYGGSNAHVVLGSALAFGLESKA